MTDVDGFLDAIRREPFEDTHRLAFADWLDENGDSDRAASVRWCVSTGCPFDMTVREWEWHYPAGYDKPPPAVWRGLNHWTSEPLHGDFVVRRGFVDELRCPVATFERYAAELFRRHPITRVWLTDRDPLLLSLSHPVEEWPQNWYWVWDGFGQNDAGYLRHHLPKEVIAWLYLRRGHRHRRHSVSGRRTHCYYPTIGAAWEAASRGLTDWARSKVGLPPLYDDPPTGP